MWYTYYIYIPMFFGFIKISYSCVCSRTYHYWLKKFICFIARDKIFTIECISLSFKKQWRSSNNWRLQLLRYWLSYTRDLFIECDSLSLKSHPENALQDNIAPPQESHCFQVISKRAHRERWAWGLITLSPSTLLMDARLSLRLRSRSRLAMPCMGAAAPRSTLWKEERFLQ